MNSDLFKKQIVISRDTILNILTRKCANLKYLDKDIINSYNIESEYLINDSEGEIRLPIYRVKLNNILGESVSIFFHDYPLYIVIKIRSYGDDYITASASLENSLNEWTFYNHIISKLVEKVGNLSYFDLFQVKLQLKKYVKPFYITEGGLENAE